MMQKCSKIAEISRKGSERRR